MFCPPGSLYPLVVGSRVANNLSSCNTPAPVSAFSRVDLPAFVYPTMPTTGTALLCLCFLCWLLWDSTFLSSAFSLEILSLMTRLSISSFFSPGPLVPIPPPSLDNESLIPTSLVALNLSCASSPCSLPS